MCRFSFGQPFANAHPFLISFLFATISLIPGGQSADQQCTIPNQEISQNPFQFDYSGTYSADRESGITFRDLPGFTRSVYERDHALVTPESRVFASSPGWSKSSLAHIITPAMGAHFAMYLASMNSNSSAAPAAPTVERFVFVLNGSLNVDHRRSSQGRSILQTDGFAYLPPGYEYRLVSASGANLVVFERQRDEHNTEPKPDFLSGSTPQQPILPVPGEDFVLRKLLPQQPAFDFNIHVMDFRPGQFLHVKEVHFNQHGLLLLSGQGIYRLAERWYPVQSGDAIWMAPFVPQWYCALGTNVSRYILYKDVPLDPLLST